MQSVIVEAGVGSSATLAIEAVIFGRTSLFGARGIIIRCRFDALFIGLINNSGSSPASTWTGSRSSVGRSLPEVPSVLASQPGVTVSEAFHE